MGQTVTGNVRKILVQQSNIAMPGSSGATFGAFPVQRYSAIAGLASIIGSATFRIQFAADSGAWLVGSSITINSGGSVFSVTNFGKIANVAFTAASSQATASLL